MTRTIVRIACCALLFSMALARMPGALANPGVVDSSFGYNGPFGPEASVWSYADDQLVAMARSNVSGKMVFAGTGTTDGVAYLSASRFNSDGSTDFAWGAGGTVKIALPFPVGAITGVAIDSADRAIFTGYAFNGTNDKMVVIVLTSGGALDTTFGGTGIVTNDFGGRNARGMAVAIDASNRIVVAVRTDEGSPYAMSATRLNTNGTTDAVFGALGRSAAVFPGALSSEPSAIFVNPAQNIVIAGECDDGSLRQSCFEGLQPFGAFDALFNGLSTTPGYLIVNSPQFGGNRHRVNALALQADGKIIAAGASFDASGTPTGYVMRLQSFGVLDTSYTGGSGVFTPFAGTNFHAVAVGPDGNVLAVGEHASGNTVQSYTQHLDTSGFAIGGFSTDAGGVQSFVAYGVVSSPTNYTVGTRGGNPGDYFIQLTLLDNTTLAELAPFGPQSDPIVVNAVNNAVAAQGANYVTVGYADDGTGRRFTVSRVTPDGILDPSFGTAGRAWLAFGGTARAVAIDAAQRIVVVGGTTGARMAVVRLQPNGALDTTFNGTGTLVLDPTGNTSELVSVEIQPDGKIVAIGNAAISGQTFMTAVRLLPNGTPDASFASGGFDILGRGDLVPGQATGGHIQPDGKILVVGVASTNNFATVVRLDALGGYDATFFGGAYQLGIGPTPVTFPAGSALMADGRIVIGGYFDFGGVLTGFLARVNPDGTPDTSFNGSGFNTYSYGTGSTLGSSVAVQSDGRILFGGQTVETVFQTGFVARMMPDGSQDLSYHAGGINLFGFSGDGFLSLRTNAILVGAGAGAPAISVHSSNQTRANGGNGPVAGIARQFGGNGSGIDVTLTGPATFTIGGTAQVTITVTNNTGFALNGLDFTTDLYTGAIVNATVPTSNCPGTATGIIGGNFVSNSGTGGSLNPGSSCTITITVQSLVATAGSISIGDLAIGANTGFVNATGALFSVAAIPPALPPASIAATSGTLQSALRGTTFAAPLSVTVLDATLAPVQNVQVTFTAPASVFPTATIVTPTSLTDVNGVATTTVIAGNLYGTYSVTATAMGVATPTNFALKNLGSGTQLNTTQIAFGNTNVNQARSAPAVQLKSVGNMPLGSITVSVNGAGFAVSSGCGATLAMLATCPITISFTPTTEGPREGTVTITTDAFASPSVILLSGNGIDLTNPLGDADGDGIPNGVEASVNTNPLAKDNDVFHDPRLFVMQQYRDFLSREGDAAGIEGWINLINTGQYSRLQVIDAFLSSQEFAGYIAPVVRLYFATFLRVPDYAGLTFNAGLVRNGTIAVVDLANFFTQSPEFMATYGALNDTQFVTLLYNNVLGRAPDTAGLNGWLALLQGGYTRGQVLVGFSDSPEYQANTANEVFVTMMYAGMLRRTPEPGGFNGWVSGMDAATYSRTQVVNGFFLSTEYHARFLP